MKMGFLVEMTAYLTVFDGLSAPLLCPMYGFPAKEGIVVPLSGNRLFLGT